MDGAPTAEALAVCASVLSRLTPADLERADCAAVANAGSSLFKRRIMTQAFGSEDVVAYLKQKHAHEKTLADLRHLREQIRADHEAARRRSETCGINAERKEQLRLIVAECAKSDSTPLLTCTDGVIEIQSSGGGDGEDSAGGGEGEGGDGGEGEGAAKGEGAAEGEGAPALPPRGDFRLHCNVCRGDYVERHPFYHQLCPRCAEHNWAKRQQSADCRGMTCAAARARSTTPRPARASDVRAVSASPRPGRTQVRRHRRPRAHRVRHRAQAAPRGRLRAHDDALPARRGAAVRARARLRRLRAAARGGGAARARQPAGKRRRCDPRARPA